MGHGRRAREFSTTHRKNSKDTSFVNMFVIYYEGTFEGIIIIIKSVKIKINKVRSFVRLFVHSFIICS